MAILRRPDRDAKRREWAAQFRLRAALERRVAGPSAREIARAGRDAAQGFEDGRDLGLDLALQDHGARLSGVLLPHYRRVFEAFGGRLIDGSRGLWVAHTRDTESFFEALAQDWIARFGAAQVARIAQTTRRQVVDALAAGQEAGEGVPAIARRIREATAGAIARHRALLIARTETHNASAAAGDAALDALELPEVLREWVAAEDTRTRATHADADGQTRAQGEPFDVGGFKLMRPGDPSAPAREIVNCRCVTAAVVAD